MSSRLILQHDGYYGLYDGNGTYLGDLPFEIHASSEPRWSRGSARVLYFIDGNQLKRHDVDSGATAVVHAFSEYSGISGRGTAKSTPWLAARTDLLNSNPAPFPALGSCMTRPPVRVGYLPVRS